MLNIRDLSFTSDGETVLDSISFTVREGETLAVIGAASAGKSALLSAVAGKMRVTGSVLDHNGAKPPHGDFLLFPQEGYIREEESVYQTVLSGRAPHRRFLMPYSPLDIQTAEEMIDVFGLSSLQRKSLSSLSDAQYKMTLLAHGAAFGSPFFLLDNPEEGLDIASRRKLVRALRKFLFDGKRCVIIATNDLNFASQCADSFLVLKNGRVAASGAHEILTEKMIQDVFGCDGVVSKNVYNGRPEIQFVPET